MLQQMKTVGHLAGLGSSSARRFRPGAIAHEPLAPGMRLKPPRQARGCLVRKEGKRLPSSEVQQEGAISVTLPQRKIIYAKDPWRDNGGTEGAADHPEQRVPTYREAEWPAQANPGSPTQSVEACRQPQRAPCSRRREAWQSLGENTAWACGITAEELTDAEPPHDPVATPREVV
jgi:hypothetical protein